MRGEGSVHFKSLIHTLTAETRADTVLSTASACAIQHEVSPDTDIIDQDSIWFNYKTISATDADRGFFLIELTEDNMEQDFSVPGPYGH